MRKSLIINLLIPVRILPFILLLQAENRMKIIAIILSLYVLALSVKPCIDIQQDLVHHHAEVSQTSEHSHQHNEKDSCSPFCTCSCCATSVIFQEYLVQLGSFPFIGKHFFPVSSIFISNPLATFWQPPKIA